MLLRIWHALRTPSDTLSEKATAGVIWMSLRQVIFQVLLLVKVVLVAKILGPMIFGIFGIALLIVNLSERFTLLGVDFALIHHDREDITNSSWTIKLVKNTVLFMLLLIGRHFFLSTFNIEDFELVYIFVISTLIFEGLVNIGVVEFRKELNYEKEFLFKVVPDLSNILVTIGLAYLQKSIWALVMGLMAERVMRLLLSYFLHPHRPKLDFSISHLKIILDYSKWIFLMGIFGFFYIQGAEILISIFLTASLLAIYQLSIKLGTEPISSVSNLIASVSIPTYAKLKDDTDAAFKTFRITIMSQLILFMIYFTVIFPIASELISVLLGEAWIGMIPIFRILLASGLFVLIIQNIEPYFLANGIQSRLIKWQIFNALAILTGGYLIIQQTGLIAMTWYILGLAIIMATGYLIELNKEMKGYFGSLISDILKVSVISVVCGLILYYIHLTFLIVNLLSLVLTVLFGGLIFLAGLLVMHKAVSIEILTTLNKIIATYLNLETTGSSGGD